MASRNKKGKIHGIFKSAFQISFFHKPSMKETDIYYYIVLEDLIMLKMRLLYDTVLVIDEVTPLSMTYLEPQYETLFTLLREQTSVTVVISLIGNTCTFRQVCAKYDTPIVEKEEFLNCDPSFYNKYRNYCRNDISRYGFYLVALREDTFSAIEEAQKEEPVPLKPETEIVTSTNQPDPSPILKPQEEEPKEPIPPWATSFITLWEKTLHMNTRYEMNKIGRPVIYSDKDTVITLMKNPGNTIGVVLMTKLSIAEKMTLISILEQYGDIEHSTIELIGIKDQDVIYNMLSDNENWVNRCSRTFCYTGKK